MSFAPGPRQPLHGGSRSGEVVAASAGETEAMVVLPPHRPPTHRVQFRPPNSKELQRVSTVTETARLRQNLSPAFSILSPSLCYEMVSSAAPSASSRSSSSGSRRVLESVFTARTVDEALGLVIKHPFMKTSLALGGKNGVPPAQHKQGGKTKSPKLDVGFGLYFAAEVVLPAGQRNAAGSKESSKNTAVPNATVGQPLAGIDETSSDSREITSTQEEDSSESDTVGGPAAAQRAGRAGQAQMQRSPTTSRGAAPAGPSKSPQTSGCYYVFMVCRYTGELENLPVGTPMAVSLHAGPLNGENPQTVAATSSMILSTPRNLGAAAPATPRAGNVGKGNGKNATTDVGAPRATTPPPPLRERALLKHASAAGADSSEQDVAFNSAEELLLTNNRNNSRYYNRTSQGSEEQPEDRPRKVGKSVTVADKASQRASTMQRAREAHEHFRAKLSAGLAAATAAGGSGMRSGSFESRDNQQFIGGGINTTASILKKRSASPPPGRAGARASAAEAQLRLGARSQNTVAARRQGNNLSGYTPTGFDPRLHLTGGAAAVKRKSAKTEHRSKQRFEAIDKARSVVRTAIDAQNELKRTSTSLAQQMTQSPRSSFSQQTGAGGGPRRSVQQVLTQQNLDQHDLDRATPRTNARMPPNASKVSSAALSSPTQAMRKYLSMLRGGSSSKMGNTIEGTSVARSRSRSSSPSRMDGDEVARSPQSVSRLSLTDHTVAPQPVGPFAVAPRPRNSYRRSLIMHEEDMSEKHGGVDDAASATRLSSGSRSGGGSTAKIPARRLSVGIADKKHQDYTPKSTIGDQNNHAKMKSILLDGYRILLKQANDYHPETGKGHADDTIRRPHQQLAKHMHEEGLNIPLKYFMDVELQGLGKHPAVDGDAGCSSSRRTKTYLQNFSHEERVDMMQKSVTITSPRFVPGDAPRRLRAAVRKVITIEKAKAANKAPENSSSEGQEEIGALASEHARRSSSAARQPRNRKSDRRPLVPEFPKPYQRQKTLVASSSKAPSTDAGEETRSTPRAAPVLVPTAPPVDAPTVVEAAAPDPALLHRVRAESFEAMARSITDSLLLRQLNKDVNDESDVVVADQPIVMGPRGPQSSVVRTLKKIPSHRMLEVESEHASTEHAKAHSIMNAVLGNAPFSTPHGEEPGKKVGQTVKMLRKEGSAIAALANNREEDVDLRDEDHDEVDTFAADKKKAEAERAAKEKMLTSFLRNKLAETQSSLYFEKKDERIRTTTEKAEIKQEVYILGEDHRPRRHSLTREGSKLIQDGEQQKEKDAEGKQKEVYRLDDNVVYHDNKGSNEAAMVEGDEDAGAGGRHT